MSFFRIYIYLKIIDFIKSIVFPSNLSDEMSIKKTFNKITNKKNSILTSQLRVGFVLVLKYLKKKYPNKNEIIVNSYNLAEMVNICRDLNLKLIFTNLNKNIFLCDRDIKKKINKNTLAILATNIFNGHDDIFKIKKICNKKKISLIEDNAIYYGNYIKEGKKRRYSGSYGDYSLHSFNIMKNISAMYGGLVSTNNNDFINFASSEIKNYKKFPTLKYLKQVFIFFILKIFSVNFFYKLLFFNVIKITHKKKIRYILKAIYPSLKFHKKINFKSYLHKIHPLSIKMVNRQLKDTKSLSINFKARMSNNIFYKKLFKKYKLKQLNMIEIKEKTFQNFNDFPIIINNKNKLQDYLFDKGIETKMIQYVDCNKIFKSKSKYKTLENYENKILCLPNHKNISKEYIHYIVDCINFFYKKSKIIN
jgi:dTDP-4-amino-4,6-dideoxygalactose transaminase